MTQREWRSAEARGLGVFLDGGGLRSVDARGEPVVDDSFLLLFNAHEDAVLFVLPPRRFGRRWALELSTPEPDVHGTPFPARGLVPVEGRAIMVLRRTE